MTGRIITRFHSLKYIPDCGQRKAKDNFTQRDISSKKIKEKNDQESSVCVDRYHGFSFYILIDRHDIHQHVNQKKKQLKKYFHLFI